MPQCNDLPPIDASIQQKTIGFDAGWFLTSGVIFTGTPTVDCSVIEVDDGATEDNDPASRLLGSPQIGMCPPPFGSNVPNASILQRLGTVVAGNRYLLVAYCATTDGDILPLWTQVWAIQPGDA